MTARFRNGGKVAYHLNPLTIRNPQIFEEAILQADGFHPCVIKVVDGSSSYTQLKITERGTLCLTLPSDGKLKRGSNFEGSMVIHNHDPLVVAASINHMEAVLAACADATELSQTPFTPLRVQS